MKKKRIGIIGGSGLYDIEGIQNVEHIQISTPYGDPSDKLILGELEGKEVVFLPRHGRGHRYLPSEVNYRANIWAMKKLDVEWILSVSAVGSLKKEIKPLDVVLVDQFIDRTNQGRKTTFFGDGIVAHIAFGHPICNDLSQLIYEAGQDLGAGSRIHWNGTYLNMEGPAFSTKAESNLYRSWDVDVIGMTNLPEAKLAREAEICLATIALVTDYDCWHEDEEEAPVSVEMVIENMNKNVSLAKKLVKGTIKKIDLDKDCSCKHALENAIMTHRDAIPVEKIKQMDLLVGKYLK